MIRFLYRNEIDDERWDRLITSSGFETVYAHAWYLDACAEHWGALVMPGYEYVMPVAFRKKFGVSYVTQPRFCQQLGVYSEKHVDIGVISKFMHALKKRFGNGSYSFNEGNLVGEEHGFTVTDNLNYTLQMLPAYEELNRSYTSNCRRNVRKAVQAGLEFSGDISIEELVHLKRRHDHKEQSDGHYRFLVSMFSELNEKGKVKPFGVKLGGNLCAGAIFAYCDKRVHYLLSVSTAEGKDKSGMFMVIDKVVQSHSGKKLLLDFEGSITLSIARFFSGFGAQPYHYQTISYNNTAGKFIRKMRNGK